MLIIGLGHKARQGKDFGSKMIKEMTVKEVRILHFADKLYEEVENRERKHALIKMRKLGKSKVFNILDRVKYGGDKATAVYETFEAEEVPFLEKYFAENNITEYWGMDEKDSKMLQFWGTDYRRKYHGDNYWVDRLKERIENLKKIKFEGIVLIPDTRFKNEVGYVYGEGGLYIDVVCVLPDGKQYLAPDRDPKHRSETELDGQQCDYRIIAQKGDIAGLRGSIIHFLKHYDIEMKNSTGMVEK